MNISNAFLQLPILLLFLLASCGGGPVRESRHWLELESGELTFGIDRDLSLSVYYGSEPTPTWRSETPSVEVRASGSPEQNSPRTMSCKDAARQRAEEYREGELEGYRVRLSGWEETDAVLGCDLTLDRDGRLHVQVSQAGGKDTIREVLDLYTLALDPGPSSYLVAPWGSGYMIRSDSPSPVSLAGLLGAEYSLPLVGLVAGGRSAYTIVDTWWNAAVRVDHDPGRHSRIALDWKASLDSLSYARRAFWVFDREQDHVDMAKAYRRHVEASRSLPSLSDRTASEPGLKRFLSGIEYRLIEWNPEHHPQVLENIRRFQAAGLPVTFFHPKWPAGERTPAGWQEYLREEPTVAGGWPAARRLEEQVHALGCSVKFFVMPHVFHEDAPHYDPSKLSGVDFPRFSDAYALEALKALLDHVQAKGLRMDALYFDGHAAHRGHSEHQSAEGPITRRMTYETQVETFREARRRGIVPGAELARFWCMGESDYFFFTDWSRDRLREGEPIPLFQLAFNDCYAAHFSGGGYYFAPKYDWYADRHPRLYELMYGAMPSHNWLPGGEALIEKHHWETGAMKRRLEWLRLWHAYFQSVGYAEMTSHQFLNGDRTLQRVEYANGVSAEFDLAQGRFRVQGVDGIEEGWQEPPVVEAIAEEEKREE
ncbi:MAG: hypothetical protein OXH11_06375 [Candidatus Aminicenantes bacterium]|nr:hypothetical protein [Candidatus Aminicenantes bacterium]